MNKPSFYLPFSLIVVLSILYISLSVPSFSLMLHFVRLLYLAFALAVVTTIMIYFKFRNQLDFDNLYLLTGSTALFSFVVWFAFIALFNKMYTTNNCSRTSYEVVSYKGRMASGYGKLEKGKIKANQWILTIRKAGEEKTFVLNVNISTDNRVTKTMDLEFCKGFLGTEFLNIEQITK